MRVDVFKGNQFSLRDLSPRKTLKEVRENWLFKIKHYNAATAVKTSHGQLLSKNSTSKKVSKTNQ